VVPVADELLGERVAALVVLVDGGRIGLDEITRHLQSLGLSKTKWPEFAFAVDVLPLTKVGKISRAVARDLARDLHSAVASAGGDA
jgi:cyclohexanecarboxylate-CoA ligase